MTVKAEIVRADIREKNEADSAEHLTIANKVENLIDQELILKRYSTNKESGNIIVYIWIPKKSVPGFTDLDLVAVEEMLRIQYRTAGYLDIFITWTRNEANTFQVKLWLPKTSDVPA